MMAAGGAWASARREGHADGRGFGGEPVRGSGRRRGRAKRGARDQFWVEGRRCGKCLEGKCPFAARRDGNAGWETGRWKDSLGKSERPVERERQDGFKTRGRGGRATGVSGAHG